MSDVLGWLRGLLAVGLLAGFYVLTFVLVAVDTVFVGLVLWAAFTAPSAATNWTLVVGGSIPAVFALLYGVAAVSRGEEPPPGAVLLPRRAAPGLWRLVEELAVELGTHPPTRIFLTPEANAAVSEEPRLLGFAVGERTMYIGVPLLRLRPAELRAVFCHEYAHYLGGHTRFGAITHRGAASLRSALLRLRMTAESPSAATGFAWFFHAVLGAYAKGYLWLSLAVRRRQELEADARAVAVVGPAVAAEALRSVHALGHAWAEFLEGFVRPVRRLGYVPEDLFGAFDIMLDDPLVQEWLAGLRERPVEAARSALDSHPPLVRRLALIEGRPAAGTREVDDEPLLVDPAPMRRVQRRILDQAPGRATAVPFARWAEVAAEAFAIDSAGPLLDAARGVSVTARPTLGVVLDLLGGGRRVELVRRFTDAPEPDGPLTEALYALVGLTLVGVDRARLVFSWTGGCLLVPIEETDRELAELVAAAARGGPAVDELRRDLVHRGVDVDAEVSLAPRTGPAPAGPVARLEITGELPAFVAEEVRRQRTVRNFTLGVLLVLIVAWGVAWLQPDEPERFPGTTAADLPGSTGLPGSAGLSGSGTLPYDWGIVPTPTLDPGSPLLAGPGYRVPSLALPSLLAPSLLAPFQPVVVERGDTLTRIACRYGTTVRELQRLNDLGSRTVIRVGQILTVPAGSGPGPAGASCD